MPLFVEYVAIVDEIATDAVLDVLAIGRPAPDAVGRTHATAVWRRQDGLWCPVPDGASLLAATPTDTVRTFSDERMAPLLPEVVKQVDRSSDALWVVPRLTALPHELAVADGQTRDLVEEQTALEGDDAWEELEHRLGNLLARMSDPSDSSHLVMSVPSRVGGGRRDPYIQVAGFGNGTKLRVEAAGNGNVGAERQMLQLSERRLLHQGWWSDPESGNLAQEHELGSAPAVAQDIVTIARRGFVVLDVGSIQLEMWGKFATPARRRNLTRLFEPPEPLHLTVV